MCSKNIFYMESKNNLKKRNKLITTRRFANKSGYQNGLPKTQ